MPRVSPIIRSGNAGLISILMEGRTDWDRYPASMRRMSNFIAAQQGPIMRRSGTVYVNDAFAHDTKSALRPFVFNNEQAQQVEFAENKVRFVDEQGVLTETPITIASVVSASPFVIEVVGLGGVVGDQIALAGFPASLGVNGVIGNVTAVASNNYTIDVAYANPSALDVSAATAAKVYSIASLYEELDVEDIHVVQDRDLMYLFCDGHIPRRLQRLGGTNWTLTDAEFEDGPYLDANEDGVSVELSATGNAATNALGTASMTGTPTSGKEPSKAFDEDDDTYWESDTDQKGRLEFDPTTDFACKAYAIHVAKDNSNTSFTSKDYAPSSFEFQGYDGSAWKTLDAQTDYVLYDSGRSVLFEINNDTVYEKYAIDITECTRNGSLKPRIAGLTMLSDTSSSIGLTFSAVDGINGGDGFVSTDVGRLLRLKGRDGMWRPMRITAVGSTTGVTAKLLGSPFPSVKTITDWRIGAWSDTTGWPTYGVFYDDKMVMAGAFGTPDLVAGSVSEQPENFAPSDPFGEVLETSSFAVRLRAKQLANVRWIETDEKALLIGTGSGEWVITAPDTNTALGPLNIRARRTSRRGSANVTPVVVDNQVLYVQKARRQIREMSYVFEKDGYKTPSMSIFSSHIGNDRFAEMDYAAEPHSIAWVRQDSGALAGLTYNRDENVIGWHVHDVGGEIESISVIPSNDEKQDILWMIVKRTINSQVRRYIERLYPFWDFGDDLDTAHFVDCGLRETFVSDTDAVYGLRHLEGEMVYGLAGGIPFDERQVVNGRILLDEEVTGVVCVGKKFVSEAESSRLDVGAADGTALGKIKRIHDISLMLWDSSGGEVGVYSEESGAVEYDPIPYNDAPFDLIETAGLQTVTAGPITPKAGYEKRGSISIRQTEPLPLNVLGIMPRMVTQDGG